MSNVADPPGDGELVAVGRVGKAHGLRGEVTVEAWSDDPQRRFAPGVVLRAGADRAAAATGSATFVIASARLHVDRWLVRFEGIDDRTAAEALRSTVLLMPARERPPIDDPEEFYDSELVGLRALDPSGAQLGTVTDVVHSAGGVHLVVTANTANAVDTVDTAARREQLVPFVAALVPTVDVGGGYVTIDAPSGLFEL